MHKTALTAALLSALAGCASESPDALEFGEADDVLAEINWSHEITNVIDVRETSAEAEVDIVPGDEDRMVVKGPLHVVRLPETGTIEIDIRSDSIVDFTFTDMEFMVLTEDADGQWTDSISIVGDGTFKGIEEGDKVSTFDSLSFTREDGMLKVETEKGSMSGAEQRLPERLGIFPIPASSGLLDLEGNYEFQINAECNGEVCPPPSSRDVPGPEKGSAKDHLRLDPPSPGDNIKIKRQR